MAPEIAVLQDALEGHRFPGGRVRIAPYEAFLGHDAMAAPQHGDDALEPLWALVIGLRGMGTDIAGLAGLAQAGPADAMLFGGLALEQHQALRSGADYDVSGAITGVSRHTSSRSGTLDRLEFTLELARDAEVHARVRSTFLFRRAT